MKIRIKLFDKTLPLPETEDRAVGFDFYCREQVTIEPRKIGLIAVNNAIEVPDGYVLLIFARSSTSWRKGLMLANGVGVIDPFYSGDKDEVKIQLFNITDDPVTVEKGEQLAQGMLMRMVPAEWEEIDSFGTDGHGGYVTTQDK